MAKNLFTATAYLGQGHLFVKSYIFIGALSVIFKSKIINLNHKIYTSQNGLGILGYGGIYGCETKVKRNVVYLQNTK